MACICALEKLPSAVSCRIATYLDFLSHTRFTGTSQWFAYRIGCEPASSPTDITLPHGAITQAQRYAKDDDGTNLLWCYRPLRLECSPIRGLGFLLTQPQLTDLSIRQSSKPYGMADIVSRAPLAQLYRLRRLETDLRCWRTERPQHVLALASLTELRLIDSSRTPDATFTSLALFSRLTNLAALSVRGPF